MGTGTARRCENTERARMKPTDTRAAYRVPRSASRVGRHGGSQTVPGRNSANSAVASLTLFQTGTGTRAAISSITRRRGRARGAPDPPPGTSPVAGAGAEGVPAVLRRSARRASRRMPAAVSDSVFSRSSGTPRSSSWRRLESHRRALAGQVAHHPCTLDLKMHHRMVGRGRLDACDPRTHALPRNR